MLGTNPVTNQFLHPDGTLLVTDVFMTVQGEGPDAGTPAVFCRLTKCNLRCFFCDTEFDQGHEYSPSKLVKAVDQASAGLVTPGLIVLTGGEPLLQNVVPFIVLANEQGYWVAIETAGTVYVPGLEKLFRPDMPNRIVCSPKTPILNERLVALIDCFKYIIREGETAEDDGLPVYSTQRQGQPMRLFRPHPPASIFVQPMDEMEVERNLRNLTAAAAIAMKYGYRLSVQIHKYAGLP